MDRIIDRLLRPEVVWVLIPLTAIVFWGISSVARSFHATGGDRDELGQCKADVESLRVRVEELERRHR